MSKHLLAAADLRDTLLQRVRDGHSATVRTTSRAGNRAVFSAEIRDGMASTPVPPGAVRKLIQAGELVEVYRQSLVTDYELSAAAKSTPTEDTADTGGSETETAMSNDPKRANLPPIGSHLMRKDLMEAGVSDWHSQKLVKTFSMGRFPVVEASPPAHLVEVTGELVAALESKGYAVVVAEGEPTLLADVSDGTAAAAIARKGAEKAQVQSAPLPPPDSETDPAETAEERHRAAVEREFEEFMGDGVAEEVEAPPEYPAAEDLRHEYQMTESDEVPDLDRAASKLAVATERLAGEFLEAASRVRCEIPIPGRRQGFEFSLPDDLSVEEVDYIEGALARYFTLDLSKRLGQEKRARYR